LLPFLLPPILYAHDDSLSTSSPAGTCHSASRPRDRSRQCHAHPRRGSHSYRRVRPLDGNTHVGTHDGRTFRHRCNDIVSCTALCIDACSTGVGHHHSWCGFSRCGDFTAGWVYNLSFPAVRRSDTDRLSHCTRYGPRAHAPGNSPPHRRRCAGAMDCCQQSRSGHQHGRPCMAVDLRAASCADVSRNAIAR